MFDKEAKFFLFPEALNGDQILLQFASFVWLLGYEEVNKHYLHHARNEKLINISPETRVSPKIKLQEKLSWDLVIDNLCGEVENCIT